MTKQIRNIAIIAHVDHGKTTLIDCLLQQSGTFDERKEFGKRVMDSNDLEQERGITITSKNTALAWKDYHINIVDTPGHADFGGEVERVLSMVDSVLLLVDAVDGPMPQTRFVTQKAFAQGLNPIVVVNKIDRDGARPDWVVDQTFDLFDSLGATDQQLDFPIVFASAINGFAALEVEHPAEDMTPLFETIVNRVVAPVHLEGPLQMRISALDYSSYVGTIGIGRINRGDMKTNMPVTVVGADGQTKNGRILQVLGFKGLDRYEVESADAGDIVAISGIEGLQISDTICDPSAPDALPALAVDEPTLTMTFEVNKSPFAGQEGKYITSRQIRERLDRELITNIALRVDDTEDPDRFSVSGRGELHLGILIENMRRENYELAVSRPEVIIKEIDGVKCEPFESVTVDIEVDHQGAIMELLGNRQAELKNMEPDGNGRVRLDYVIPTRGLIGIRTVFLTLTSGGGLMHYVFDHYGPIKGGPIGERKNGVLISNGTGKAVGFALFNLQERGKMMVEPGTAIYEGMVVGLHARNNDLTVNALKGKQLTNVRASGTDENIQLTPPMRLTLEQSLEFLNDDELAEVTPENIRIRKRHLTETDRKRHSRGTVRA